ncbi:hypothetical protein Taro_006513, partial [Colocasia esculenta]|nr:hypothetical protein [Colocasia esculenta]
GLELQERRKKLDRSSSPRFLLLLGLFSTSKNPFARDRAGHEGLRGSVNTIINGVDTMAQNKGRNVKKRSTSVDTRPGQVDTTWNQVDIRWLSQKAYFAVWDSRSTRDHLR